MTEKFVLIVLMDSFFNLDVAIDAQIRVFNVKVKSTVHNVEELTKLWIMESVLKVC